MDENISMNVDNTMEIDLREIIYLLLSKIWLIVFVGLFGGLVAFIYSNYFIDPVYQSKLSLYVFNADAKVKETSTNDLLMAQRLVNSYIAVLKSDKFLNEVIDDVHLDTKPEKLRKKVIMEAIKDTELFEVTVEAPSPNLALKIASSITKLAPRGVEQIVKTGRTEVVDTPVLADKPSFPNIKVSTIIGVVIGLVVASGGIILKDMFDITVKSKEEIINRYSVPILGSIPLVGGGKKK